MTYGSFGWLQKCASVPAVKWAGGPLGAQRGRRQNRRAAAADALSQSAARSLALT